MHFTIHSSGMIDKYWADGMWQRRIHENAAEIRIRDDGELLFF